MLIRSIIFVCALGLNPDEFEAKHGHAPFENPNITEKYDDWEFVMKTLFVISCRSKHSTDVVGQAKAEWNATSDHMDMDGYMAVMRKIQGTNIAAFKQSCGMITGKGLPKCRMSCQTNHGDQMAFRDACDTKCEQKFKVFEDECYNKVQTLGSVYDIELGKITNYKYCADMYCPDYPVTTNCSTMNITSMEQCKDDMVTDMHKNATTDFCTALWDWIYESEGRDPATGDPIVFTQLVDLHSTRVPSFMQLDVHHGGHAAAAEKSSGSESFVSGHEQHHAKKFMGRSKHLGQHQMAN